MMKKLIISLFILFFAASIFAAEVVLWATTDMHGNIITEKGGMARIASFLQQKRSKDDILIDAGDLLQGSFSANVTKGTIALSTFNTMNYDFFVPGNHEFEFGRKALFENLKNINAQILCCNWSFIPHLQNMKPYSVIVRKGLRIGIIGAGERESRCRILPDKMLKFEDEAVSVARALAALRKEKVDLIVLVRHGGIYFAGGSLYSLLKLFPEIDLVIGGHSHELVRGRKIAGAYYVQPGKHAEGISEIRIKFDEKKRKIIRISSSYHDVSSYPAPKSMKDILSQEKTLQRTGYLEFRRKLPSNLKNITDVQKYLILQSVKNKAVGDADIFFADKSGLEWRSKLNNYLVYRMFPYENKLTVIPVSVKEFNIILDECRRYSQKYKTPLVTSFNAGNKKYFLLRTTSFVLSGGGRNFPRSRRIAEARADKIREFCSLKEAVVDYLNCR